MAKFLISCCSEDGCSEVGRANDLDAAKRKAMRAAKKAAKRFRGEAMPDGEVRVAIYEVERGIVSDDSVWEAHQGYGEPHRRKRAKREE